MAQALEKRFPKDTSVRFSYLPALRALSALHCGAPGKAIEVLESATPYDLATLGIAFFGFFGAIYPAYIRGQAYLAEHRSS